MPKLRSEVAERKIKKIRMLVTLRKTRTAPRITNQP